MATDKPLDKLVLGAASLADDLAFVAISDLFRILDQRPTTESRLIGGIMVTLLVQRWGLGSELYRQTGDADIGVPPMALKDPWIVEGLLARGYERTAGNRFEKEVQDLPSNLVGLDPPSRRAAIDILVPAYSSRPRENLRIGEVSTTEVRGLAYAFKRPPLEIQLEMARLNGDTLLARVPLPQETASLVLRSFAWHVRGASRDAVDLWRALEIAAASGANLATPTEQDEEDAKSILVKALDSPGNALRTIAENRRLDAEAGTQFRTRLRALLKRVLE